MKTNRLVPTLLACGLLGASPALAQNGPVKVSVDSSPVPFLGQQPISEQGHVLVPLRGVFEKMGAKVAYDAASHQVTAKSDKSSVDLTVGSMRATVDGKPVTLEAPTKITNGAVLVPLRFVSESLGSAVRFDKATRTVLVDTSKTPAPSQGTADLAEDASTPTATPPVMAPPTQPMQTASAPTPQPVQSMPVPSGPAQPMPNAPAQPMPTQPMQTTPTQQVQTAPPGPAQPMQSVPVQSVPLPIQQPVVTRPVPHAPIFVAPAPVAVAGPGIGQIVSYILGALILLGIVAWFLNRRGKTGQVIAADEKTRR